MRNNKAYASVTLNKTRIDATIFEIWDRHRDELEELAVISRHIPKFIPIRVDRKTAREGSQID